jgi:hypothetical protein
MISDAHSAERASWSVGDDLLLAELTRMVGLSSEEIAALAALQERARGVAPALTETFYARLTAFENTNEYFVGVDLSRMHRVTGEWFVDLFSGRYDDTYVKGRLTIGLVHVKIGLPIRYPLAMLDLIGEFGERVTAQSETPEMALRAFRKVLSLDVAVFNQAYENSHLRHLAELVGGERLARRLLSGQA